MNKKGTLGTLYIGSLLSKRYFRVCDKAKQLAEVKKQKVVFPATTRIEVTLRTLGCAACELHEVMANPFAELLIVRRALAQVKYPDDDMWQKFLDEAREIGSAAALKKQPKKARRQQEHRLPLVVAAMCNAARHAQPIGASAVGPPQVSVACVVC